MRIGIDFDNTIVCYDQVFHQVALERQLIPEDVPVSKSSVRDYLRSSGRENDWTELQGFVYGNCMDQVTPFQGVGSFFLQCRQRNIETCIISHKTRHPYLGPAYDLHKAARDWLVSQDFMNGEPANLRPRVFLEETKQEKLRRIAQTNCDYFVDDLHEFLSESTFPENVRRIHFDPSREHKEQSSPFHRVTAWDEIQDLILNSKKDNHLAKWS